MEYGIGCSCSKWLRIERGGVKMEGSDAKGVRIGSVKLFIDKNLFGVWRILEGCRTFWLRSSGLR